MRSRSFYIFITLGGVFFTLHSCETKSSRYIPVNTSFLSLKPANQYQKLFANASGDTVQLYLSANESSNGEDPDGYNLGSIGTGITRFENRHYTLSCEAPYLRLDYEFTSTQNSADQRGYSDLLNLSISDSSGTSANRMGFYYQNDTVYLAQTSLVYYDTLNIIGQSFTEVYQPSEGLPNEELLFYYKNGPGIVGFKTRNGVVYELVN